MPVTHRHGDAFLVIDIGIDSAVDIATDIAAETLVDITVCCLSAFSLELFHGAGVWTSSNAGIRVPELQVFVRQVFTPTAGCQK